MPVSIQPVDPDSFALMKEDWNDLLRRSASDTVFLRWEWLHTWWEAFGRGRTLCILAARDGGRLVGAAPFYLEEDSRGVRHLRFCSDELYPDGLDVISERGREREVVGATASWLFGGGLRWDVASLRHVGSASVLPGLLRGSGRTWRAGPPEPCPYIRMEGTFEAYAEGRPRLADVLKKEKRLLEKGITHRVIREEGELPKAMDDLFLLHDKRAREKGITTVFTSEGIQAFHRRLAGQFLKEKILNLQFLTDGENAVSALYSFHYKRKIYFYQSGFDPAWRAWSVGAVMIAVALRRAFQDGLEEFDFLKGDEGYKALWMNAVREERALSACNRSLRGMVWGAASRGRAALGVLRRSFAGYPPWSPARSSLK